MRLVDIIRSQNPAVRNHSVDEFAKQASTRDLISECAALDEFWRKNENLYERVRALFFLYAIYRFHLPERRELQATGRSERTRTDVAQGNHLRPGVSHQRQRAGRESQGSRDY